MRSRVWLQMRDQLMANSISESTPSTAQIKLEIKQEKPNSSVWTKKERSDPEVSIR